MKITSPYITCESRPTRLDIHKKQSREEEAILSKCLENLFPEVGIRSCEVKPWDHHQEKCAQSLRQYFSSKQFGDYLALLLNSSLRSTSLSLQERWGHRTACLPGLPSLVWRTEVIKLVLSLKIFTLLRLVQSDDLQRKLLQYKHVLQYIIPVVIQSQFYKFLPNLSLDLSAYEPKSCSQSCSLSRSWRNTSEKKIKILLRWSYINSYIEDRGPATQGPGVSDKRSQKKNSLSSDDPPPMLTSS